jgi:hypothetical protein
MMQTLRNKLVENEYNPGQKTVSNWRLPSGDFSYGKKIIPDKEGAGVGINVLI